MQGIHSVTLILLFIGVIAAVWTGVLAAYAATLIQIWREPVLCYPVAIIESDDWGAGSLDQVAALQRLHKILSAVHDQTHHAPVMTLGVVLGVADTEAIRQAGGDSYHRLTLRAPGQAAILDELRVGIDAGVFAPQLHGLEHYWPAALMRAARHDARIQAWLGEKTPHTEALPDALQSRWIDAAELPSRALTADAVATAVNEESSLFQTLFHQPPRVAVPNTFVWTADVERAWAASGVRFVVTPGTRYTARDAQGRLLGDKRTLRNAQQGAAGITYLVRDVYFEPARGHVPHKVVADIRVRAALGRPALIESHRANYLGSQAAASFSALHELLRLMVEHLPRVRFISTQALGEAMLAADPELVEQRFAARWMVWVRRALVLPRFGRLARLTGLAALMQLSARAVSMGSAAA